MHLRSKWSVENTNVNLPERVKVGGFWYSIEAENALLQAEGLLGEIVLHSLTIRLDDSAAPPVVKTIFLHFQE